MLLSNYVFWFLRSELESLNVVVLNVDEFESSDASSRSANDKPLLGRALKNNGSLLSSQIKLEVRVFQNIEHKQQFTFNKLG